MEGMLILLILFLACGPFLGLYALAKANRLEAQLEALKLDLSRLELKGWTSSTRDTPAKATPPEPPVVTQPQPAAEVIPPPLPIHKPAPSKTVTPPLPPLPPLRPSEPQPNPTQESFGIGIDWRSWLRRLHLCPPEKEASGEVGLAAWWTTRIGILLGVIAVVFLGVYVNRVTAPWIRLCELLSISVGVFAAGHWLQKRLGRFGDIVSSGGLAMLFFTAYASHGVAAVQITSQAWLGTSFQVVALGFMLAWSLHKRDSNLASAGIGLGYVSCTFAAGHGLAWMTLGGLVLLGVVGSVLLARCQWRLPFLVSAVGSYTGLFLLTLSLGNVVIPQRIFITATTLLFSFTAGLWWMSRNSKQESWPRRAAIGQASGASIAVIGSSLILGPSTLSNAYLLLFIAFAIHTALSWSGRFLPALFPVWTVKALTFLALFVVAEFDGPTRWLGLIAQSFGILWAMRGKDPRPRWMEIPFLALWVASFAFYWNDVFDAQALKLAIFDTQHLVSWSYLLVAMLLATLYHKSAGAQSKPSHRHQPASIAMAMAVGIGSFLSFQTLPNSTASTCALACVASLMLGLSWWQRSRLPLIAGGLLAVGTHLHFWQLAFSPLPWWIPIMLALVLGGLGYAISHRAIRIGNTEPEWLDAVITPVWMGALLISGAVCGVYLDNLSYEIGGVLAFVAASILASIGSAGLLAKRTAHAYRLILLATVGCSVAVYAMFTLEAIVLPWSLVLTVGLILAITKSLKDKLLSAVIVAPATLSTLVYLVGPQGTPWPITNDLTLGVVMMLGFTLGAWWFSQELSNSTHRKSLWMDGLMHVATLLILFCGAERHVGGPMHWLLMCATTCGLALAAKRLPFPTLPWIAWLLPILLISREIVTGFTTAAPTLLYWIGSAILVLAWRATQPSNVLAISVSAASLVVTAFLTFDGATLSGALTTMALGYAFLFRYQNEHDAGKVAIVVQSISVVIAFATVVLGSATIGLAWIVWTCIGTATQGWLLKSLSSALPIWRDALRTWAHGASALMLLQISLLVPSLGSIQMATAWWGLTSIALFIGGLFGGLRAYRMIGLLGLITCIARMFAVDIDDTFYRIIAFAVVALVLLGVGFLYTRFRRWIESQDEVA